MKPGQASQTAVMVCRGRAVADSDPSLAFSDPTAFALLPDDAREKTERMRRGEPPRGFREVAERAYIGRLAKAMVVRTSTIDSAVRDAASPQLVILGAGLDGRAWRMRELSDTVVFEVDHPDSQRDKRARVASLTRAAREVNFVPVDFAHDDLDASLAAAGHDPTQPTTWIWEGVVMYLARRDIEATLEVVARRSKPGSRLLILYHRPALAVRLVGLAVRLLGEPLRSAFQPEEMQALLANHHFEVVRDRGLPELGAAMSPALGEAMRAVRHLRIVAAARL